MARITTKQVIDLGVQTSLMQIQSIIAGIRLREEVMIRETLANDDSTKTALVQLESDIAAARLRFRKALQARPDSVRRQNWEM